MDQECYENLTPTPENEDFVEADRSIRTTGARFARFKSAGQEFMTAKAKWCFFVNNPTKYDVSTLVQIHMYNDAGRNCGYYPVGAMYCTKRNARNEISCKKCIMRNIIIDCHDFLTDLFILSAAFYAKNISISREMVKIFNKIFEIFELF